MTENLPPNTDLPVDSQPLGTNDPQIAPGKPSQKRALFIGAAALVGVAVVAAAIIIPITMASESRKSQIVDAVEVCGVEAGTYAILDDGNAVDFDAAGLIIGADIDDVFCVLDELGAPQSIESKIGQTRSLDGTREATWEGFAAQWTYHPDDGLNLLVERTG